MYKKTIKAYGRILMLFLFLCTINASVGQKIWTLEDCINWALTNNLDIKNQVLTVEINKKQL